MLSKTVSIVKCDAYEIEKLIEKVKEVISLAGGINVRGKKVLLKINMLSGADPRRASITNPSFIEAVITVFQTMGAKVFVGDSPGVHSTDYAGKKSGIKELVEKNKATWVDFSEKIDLKNPAGELVKKFTVARIIDEVDFIVCLPKLKTHSFMYCTGAMKNMFGTIPGMLKARMHFRFPDRTKFSKMIADLNLLLKTDLTIMDAVIGMEGQGPYSGDPRKIGLILASKNILAIDCIAFRLIGYDPKEIPITNEGLNRKHWLDSEDEIKIAGEKIEPLILKDFKKIKILRDIGIIKKYMSAKIYRFVQKMVIPRPIFKKKKCILCSECVQICPSNALIIKSKKEKKYIAIDRSKCFLCYCCHEICPAKAIHLRKYI